MDPLPAVDLESSLLRAWSDAFTSEVLRYAKTKEVDNEEVFADVYHSLVHSPLAATLVQLEHSNAQAVDDRAGDRDTEVNNIEKRYERPRDYSQRVFVQH